MLMIHVGPLFSALQALSAAEPPPITAVAMHGGHGLDSHAQHAQHAQHAAHSSQTDAGQHAAHAASEPSGNHGMHHRSPPGAPAWLAALEMCGYCELLTLNPPLSLSLQLVLPEHQPTFALALPEAPQPAVPRRSSGHPRAPPVLHS